MPSAYEQKVIRALTRLQWLVEDSGIMVVITEDDPRWDYTTALLDHAGIDCMLAVGVVFDGNGCQVYREGESRRSYSWPVILGETR